MDSVADSLLYAGTLSELKAAGHKVLHGGRTPILVVWHRDRVYALDNRCPHLGFPLDRGSIEDGILTCHWHHARFDITSGCTFDLWADDVPPGRVELRGEEIWVAPECGFADPARHWRQRLTDGMAHNIGLVIGKAVLGSLDAGAKPQELVRAAARFGARNRDGWSFGQTILANLAGHLDRLPDEIAYLALYQGIRRVAADCEGQTPRRDRQALSGAEAPLPTLETWLAKWSAVRQRNAAERTLLTAVEAGASQAEVAALLLGVVSDRYFADGGHALDYINKCFDCLEVVGWDQAATLLPTLVEEIVTARGGEESDAWRNPIDTIALQEAAFARLPELLAAAPDEHPAQAGELEALADRLLAEEPQAVIAALEEALASGLAPAEVGRALAYAAALRVARFATSNEFSDWDSAHHVFTFCSAVQQMLARIGKIDAPARKQRCLRSLYHGAVALYLIRYLNRPPARLPDPAKASGLPDEPNALCRAILESFDRQQQVNGAAALVARYLDLGHPPDALISTLAEALLREDAGFHSFQILDAAIRQFDAWRGGGPGRNILVAATRFLAAHSPTERAHHQTARIAQKLHRGGQIEDSDTE